MTAEALVCWQFLGLDREHPACNEAGDSLMANLPGDGAYNLYYWYYATLGMYQLQDAPLAAVERGHSQRARETAR